ncbi:Uncharacterized protein DAT39_021190 [Clarias magur]|uniref:Uncharacterized protein n=1 Tax=Clarias magur TaxID=1594786 RepID=A0A8J4T699_CLAMG|nr:Uncharacterized protein DAT39_021190 [Clarias magur]
MDVVMATTGLSRQSHSFLGTRIMVHSQQTRRCVKAVPSWTYQGSAGKTRLKWIPRIL